MEHLDEKELIDLVLTLVRIESHKEFGTEENEIAQHIYDLFKKEGINTELKEIELHRPNVYGFVGEDTGKTIMLNGHTDTVPALGMEDAFQPVIKLGRIYGRGALDMKGAIAAMMMSLILIKRSGIKLDGKAIFTGVIDEEKRSQGAEKMADQEYPKADVAIVGEPTNLDIMYGHKGMEWIEITVYGQSGHGSTPNAGKNAIHIATDLIMKIRENLIPKLKERAHPILGEPTVNIGKIQGGDDPNVIPGLCKIQLDRRWVPEETIESMQKDIHDLIDEMKVNDPTLEITTRRMSEATGTHSPLYTSPDHPFVADLTEAIKVVTSRKPKYGVFQGWSDGAHLSRKGTTTLVCGPGELSLAHSAKESIEIEEIIKAAKIYTYTILKVLDS
ncbi:M20 family metallopeptidase [Planococcus sp. ISL-109]|uniref:M20 family metallopeptidase n=1 Tax=Planococcus sp. ISL-109 TaxID=2819166 RepID=UPI001BE9FEFC|nr:M20 family metallopeptidase [Planococcus sp. ISL-109]MBT2582815.1 M20 family metallopeptidase [Planococcus sp. ISL-109]